MTKCPQCGYAPYDEGVSVEYPPETDNTIRFRDWIVTETDLLAEYAKVLKYVDYYDEF